MNSVTNCHYDWPRLPSTTAGSGTITLPYATTSGSTYIYSSESFEFQLRTVANGFVVKFKGQEYAFQSIKAVTDFLAKSYSEKK